MKTIPSRVSRQEFDELFKAVLNWGRWGTEDERGTLNYITPQSIRSAVSLVRSGQTVSMAIPINKTAGPDNPRPAIHYMVQGYDVHSDLGEPQFCSDFLASEFHGDCHTHIDALCHTAYKGGLYNGKPAASVTTRGPEGMDITVYECGIIGRGVLLDIPRLRGLKWLEPGEAVTRDELEAAEKTQGVRSEKETFSSSARDTTGAGWIWGLGITVTTEKAKPACTSMRYRGCMSAESRHSFPMAMERLYRAM